MHHARNSKVFSSQNTTLTRHNVNVDQSIIVQDPAATRRLARTVGVPAVAATGFGHHDKETATTIQLTQMNARAESEAETPAI